MPRAGRSRCSRCLNEVQLPKELQLFNEALGFSVNQPQ